VEALAPDCIGAVGGFLRFYIAYDQGMEAGLFGWILHVGSPQHDRLEPRTQLPCFVDAELGPVHEVWIWHRLLHRWFCMTYGPVPDGVVAFAPGDTDVLRSTMAQLEHAAGIVR
jgi:hypothetical protein